MLPSLQYDVLWIYERVRDIGRHYSAQIQYETNSQQLLQESSRCNLSEKTSLLGLRCTSRNKVMLMMRLPCLRYFWFHSIYSLAASCSLLSAVRGLQRLQSAVCSLQSAVCSLRSAVCSLQMSYTAITGSLVQYNKPQCRLLIP